jgi:flavin-dependent dehydrogenase
MILVVGAGLAGLTYAHKAVTSGEKVEVWEKDCSLGLKPCGEALLDNALDSLPLTERQLLLAEASELAAPKESGATIGWLTAALALMFRAPT